MSETNTTTGSEPIEFVTPIAKSKVMIRPYATARLRKATRGVFLKYASLDTAMFKGKSEEQIKDMNTGDLTKFKDEIPAEVVNDINEATIKYMVISVDGSTDEVVDTCLDMRDKDYDALIEKCNEIAGQTDLSDEKKTT